MTDDYNFRDSCDPRTAMKVSPTCMSSIQMASHQTKTPSQVCFDQYFGESGFHLKIFFRFADLIVVELSFVMRVPLKTETRSAALAINKARDPVYQIRTRTHLAAGTAGLVFHDLFAAAQTSQDCLRISGEGWSNLPFRNCHRSPITFLACGRLRAERRPVAARFLLQSEPGLP